MKIFIDFDDILFNTKRFKLDYLRCFEKYGVSKELFDECYYDPLSKGSVKKYDPAKHICRIFAKHKNSSAGLEQEVVAFVADTRKYVFSDVFDFVKKNKRSDLFIISYSVTDFQKAKIANCGISNFFKTVEITNKLKSGVIGKTIKKEKIDLRKEAVYFIEDRLAQIENVKKLYPRIKTILLKRKEGRYFDEKNKYCDFQCNSLGQVEKILLKKDGK
jgi:FMN phosphatase YigB (HAD superfamily)